ncbi:MAG TPA: hypothetical protein VFE61_04535 [Candidatus Sulfotelmatobacter sp.]|nr:hypothetical protein [Candidatus Sulfotelmatobacter sp.]
MLVLDNGNCFLYELYNASVNSNGSWNADSTAVWDLLGNEQRPYTWTSADAAGLPVFSWAGALRRSGGRKDSACVSIYIAEDQCSFYSSRISRGGNH